MALVFVVVVVVVVVVVLTVGRTFFVVLVVVGGSVGGGGRVRAQHLLTVDDLALTRSFEYGENDICLA